MPEQPDVRQDRRSDPNGHHIVPRFYLARWEAGDGRIEIFDRVEREHRLVKPVNFYKFERFNTVVPRADEPADWVESELLAGLDNAAARLIPQLVRVPGPKSQLKITLKTDVRPGHLLPPKATVSLSMFAASLAVRGPNFRQAMQWTTAREVERILAEKTSADLRTTTDPGQIAQLQELTGVRILTTGFDRNWMPELVARLTYELGEVLCTDYMWSVRRVDKPTVWTGDEPLVILNEGDSDRTGSYSDIVTAGSDRLHLWQEREEVVAAAKQKLRGHDIIMLSLDPRHILMLTKVQSLVFPGMYDYPASAVAAFNGMVMKASQRWMCRRPGPVDVTEVPKLPRAEPAAGPKITSTMSARTR